jgi:hypothetical protein
LATKLPFRHHGPLWGPSLVNMDRQIRFDFHSPSFWKPPASYEIRHFPGFIEFVVYDFPFVVSSVVFSDFACYPLLRGKRENLTWDDYRGSFASCSSNRTSLIHTEVFFGPFGGGIDSTIPPRSKPKNAAHWLNRKNCRVPEIGFVTVFSPFTTTGAGRLVVQTVGIDT